MLPEVVTNDNIFLIFSFDDATRVEHWKAAQKKRAWKTLQEEGNVYGFWLQKSKREKIAKYIFDAQQLLTVGSDKRVAREMYVLLSQSLVLR